MVMQMSEGFAIDCISSLFTPLSHYFVIILVLEDRDIWPNHVSNKITFSISFGLELNRLFFCNSDFGFDFSGLLDEVFTLICSLRLLLSISYLFVSGIKVHFQSI